MTATHAPTAAAPTAGRRPAPRRVLWGAQILISAFLVFASGLPKLAGQADAVETFALLGWNDLMRYLVGAVEVAGAVGLVIPRLAGLAATGLIGLMIGAVLTQILVIEPAWALFPAALGAVFAVVAWDRRAQTRAQTRALLGALRR
ncbi:DoxX family protein [Actinomadura sp. WMMB 499]|uniref:DoxX family protein n=1 Tax=Actinomadura sp. WMMB 499 TaxID=1219491 RepID=UPI0012480A6F|nr:DoxX family protein [Actinomadura sp. WMMB 499]QFG19828.1 DoxX family protein [Actinomadura sp. WMMB 499]